MNGCLLELHMDILSALKSIKDIKGRQYFDHINIWNNQIEMAKDKENKGYAWNTPAAFIEIVLGETRMLGAGVISYPECRIVLHLASRKLNEPKLGMDRNLDVFSDRDEVVRKFNGYSGIRRASALMLAGEEQDFEHTNLYEYTLNFRTSFIDTTGSLYDENLSERYTNENLTLETIFQNSLYESQQDEVYENEVGEVYQNSNTNGTSN